MNDRNKYLIELRNAESGDDLNKKILNFELLTNSLFTITQSMYASKLIVRYHQSELEGKYFRFGMANQSVIKLIKGNSFTLINQNVNLVDIFSINSISRMQIESYLLMYYLFFDNIPDFEKEFRYDVYKLHGLLKQSNFEITTDKEELMVHRDKIISEIEILVNRITASNIFEIANEKERTKYLKPRKPKLMDTETLFEKCDFKQTRINDLWQLYSNYAHSEHISDRQFNYSLHNADSIRDNCSLIINVHSILTARLIKYMIDNFECAKKVYTAMTEKEKVPIDIWSALK